MPDAASNPPNPPASGEDDSPPNPPMYYYVLTKKQYYSQVNIQCVHEVITGVMRLCLERTVKDVDRAIGDHLLEEEERKKVAKDEKARTIIDNKIKKFSGKSYKDLDTTNLLDIMPKITKIRQDNTDSDHKSLWKSILNIKNIRNDVVHVDNNATYSEETMGKISQMINEIIDLLAKISSVDSSQVTNIKDKFEKEMKVIQDGSQTNEFNIKSEIKQRVKDENERKWAPMVEKSMKFEKLQFGNELVSVSLSAIFHEAVFEVILATQDNPEDPEYQDHRTLSCTDILSRENNTNIDIIMGEPGTGKTTFLRMMSLEFCKSENGPNVIFKTITSYSIFMLINCRDRVSICNFWEYFGTHYKETARIFPQKMVISALKEVKMVIAIDGLDEANTASEKLVSDLIHIFAGSETVKFVITTRTGFCKNVVELFDQRAILYRVLKIKPIADVIDQEKFICKVMEQMPSNYNVHDILKTFRAKHEELKLNFLRPLGLNQFIALSHYVPEKIEKITLELSRLSYEMHSQNMTKRLPDAISNSSQCSRAILKLLGRKSLQLIQNTRYEIDEENFKSLLDECRELDKDIPVWSVISCVLNERKSSKATEATTYCFSQRSEQEYFASKVLTERLLQEYFNSNTSPKKVEKLPNSKLMTREDELETEPTEILRILVELTGTSVEKQHLLRLVLRFFSDCHCLLFQFTAFAFLFPYGLRLC